MEGDFFTAEKQIIECHLCPHNCKLKEGQDGVCLVRGNRGGKGVLLYYGCITAEALDPMEKKPLYHFLPGKKIYSVGFAGCNLKCPFCQNSSISQYIPAYYHQQSPHELIEKVKASGAPALAFTYSEPLIHFEYIYSAAKLAKENSLRTVLITNGMVNRQPAKKLLPFIDACNIDLKSFSQDNYSKILKGDLDTVKGFISLAALQCHVEVTTLIVPDFNDTDEEIDAISSFLSSVDSEIIYHISAYYPSYKYKLDAVTQDTVEHFAEVARKKIMFVYKGNTGSDNSLYCPECGELMIQRRSYNTVDYTSPGGHCRKCGKEIKIIY